MGLPPAVRGPDGSNPVKNISGTDLLGGCVDPASSSFTVPVAPAAGAPPTNLRLTGFVTTRGGAYCFLPSITAIRHLAQAAYPAPSGPG